MSLYGKIEYWNRRYTVDKGPYDWYQKYSGVKHLLTAKTFRNESFPSRKECRVLVLGCGNSQFGEDMLRDDWRGKIVNVDYSPVVIEQMQSKYDDKFYKELQAPYNRACRLASISEDQEALQKRQDVPVPKMEFLCADVLNTLPFEDDSFDLIVCKGTLDSILCSAGSVANAKTMMHECSRLLDSNHGAMVVVTYGNADSRLVYFENPGGEWWENVKVEKVVTPGVPKPHYVYIGYKRDEGKSAPGESVDGKEDRTLRPSSSDEENDAAVKLPQDANPRNSKAEKKKKPATDLVRLVAANVRSLR